MDDPPFMVGSGEALYGRTDQRGMPLPILGSNGPVGRKIGGAFI